MLTSGHALIILSLCALLIPRRGLPLFLVGSMLTGLALLFVQPDSVVTPSLGGFSLQLHQYHLYRQIAALSFALFGLATAVFLLTKPQSPLFYTGAIAHVGAAISVVFANDGISFFVFWELLSLSAVLLLLVQGHAKLVPLYLTYQMASATFLLIAIGVSYSAIGNITLPLHPSTYLLVFFAIALKAAVFPFHSWLVQVYPAVDPALTVLLSAYGTKVGVFGLWLLAPGLQLEILGGLVAVAAIIYAFKQHSIRRFLSFHMVSQIGYMVAAFGAASSEAALGGVLHLGNNIIYKGLLFMIAAVILQAFGTDDMLKIGGAGRKSPFLLAMAIIASISIAGLPPLNGYFSKSALSLELLPITYHLLTIATVGTSISFSKFLYYTFFQSNDGAPPFQWPLCQKFSLLSLASLCVFLGIYPATVFEMGAYSFAKVGFGLITVLAGLVLFKLWFEQIHSIAVRISPETNRIGQFFLWLWNGAGRTLQLVHSGDAQTYLLWFFAALSCIWLYLRVQ